MGGINLHMLQIVMGHTTSRTTEWHITLSKDAVATEVKGGCANIYCRSGLNRRQPHRLDGGIGRHPRLKISCSS